MTTLKSLEYHGLEINSEAGGQYLCDCPFCGKENHFYLHPERLVWQCHSCGAKGNADQYLAKIADEAFDRMTGADWRRLSKYRQLPAAAFKAWRIGKSETGEYLIPVRTSTGQITDLRRFQLNRAVSSTEGCAVGLLGIDRIGRDAKVPVYLCEGEWDAIALSHSLSSSGLPGLVLAVPGANTFKREWIPFFHTRTVYVCYDNDPTGREGAKKVYNMLRGVTKLTAFVHWPESREKGWDVRDHVLATRSEGDEATVNSLLKLMRDVPPAEEEDLEGSGPEGTGRDLAEISEPPIEPIAPSKLIETFRKWLIMDDTAVIDVLVGVIYANMIDRSSPIWLLLNGLSGGGKSEILNAFRLAEGVYTITNLTPNALVSGAMLEGGVDASLLPRLDKQVLIIKDFTAILSMPAIAREEIFGILRDAYDGRFVKEFGTGVRKEYDSHFGVIAGVTPAIDSMGLGGDLGERFLQFRLPGLSEDEETRLSIAALEGASRGEERQAALARAVAGALAYPREIVPPDLSPEQKRRIVTLAKITAALRAHPARDGRTGTLTGPPRPEVPTRLSVQFGREAQGISIGRIEKEVTDYVMGLIKKIGLDTANQTKLEIVRRLRDAGSAGMPIDELASRMYTPRCVVEHAMEVMSLQQIVKKVETRKAHSSSYTVSGRFLDAFNSLEEW